MKTQALKTDLLMLIAAAIWGFAFVAQREGMETMGPFLFSGVRFLIGVVALSPVVWYLSKKPQQSHKAEVSAKKLILAGTVAGLLLFGGISCQQVGLQYTTAGKAGFITGLYIFFVPLIGLFLGQRTGSGTWLGATIALFGLYLLSIKEDFTIAEGDLLQLICAVFFAAHVLVIGYLAKRMDTLKLALVQYLVCGVISLLIAIAIEMISWDMIVATTNPMLYAGVMSTGIAYTLQVVAQQHAHSSDAAIILSLEGAFAVLGGWLLLDEHLPARGLLGCALMLTGMFLSQLFPKLGSPLKSR